jgi:hypothetical protein
MTNTNIATLRDYLKTELAAATALSSVGSWRNGQPLVLPTAPFGWVRALGGAKEPSAYSTKKVLNNFEIVVVCKNADVDTAEDSALALEKAIEDLIDADSTLGGYVSAAWVSNRESQQWNEGRACFSAWKVTVSSWAFS